MPHAGTLVQRERRRAARGLTFRAASFIVGFEMTTTASRYFDYAASAPPFPEALQAQAAAAARWFANPSAAHPPGREAHAEWERLKAGLAGACGFENGRVVITSGATESNNMVLHAVLDRKPNARIAVAADVHASLWNAAHRPGRQVDVLPLDSQGRLTPETVAAALRGDTAMVCVSHAANETGVIHDVAAIATECRRRGVLCLVDGAQALGHVPVDLRQVPCDFYTFSAHKFGGPRGCGGVLWRSESHGPLLWGGGQEDGLRSGTENLPGLAGAVEALTRALCLLPDEAPRLRGLAVALVRALREAGVAFELNGDPAAGLAGLVSLSFDGAEGATLAADLALQGFAVATGSACHADQVEPSRAILALGRAPAAARGTIRVSCGRLTLQNDVMELAAALTRAAARERGQARTAPAVESPVTDAATATPPDLAVLGSCSPALVKRLRTVIRNHEPHFILMGSDPADSEGCCSNSEVGEANRLVRAGVLARHQPPSAPGTCTTTVYALAGEIEMGAEGPQFHSHAALRQQVLAALDEDLWRRRSRLRLFLRYLVLVLFTASLTLAVRKAVTGLHSTDRTAAVMLDRALGVTPDDRRLFVVFFQEDASCEPCRTMRRLTERTLREHYADRVAAGDLVFREVRLGDAANVSLRTSLGLGMSSVGLARYEAGRCAALRLLTEDVWRLYTDETAFMDMLHREIGRMGPARP